MTTLMALAGAVLVIGGLVMIYIPAALIVAGVLVGLFAVALEVNGRGVEGS